jgi:hypothetical protein
MFPRRNVGLVPFGFTRASAVRVAAHLIDDSEDEVYAAWYWQVDPIVRVVRDDIPVHKGPLPDGIAVWTSRRVLLIALRFTGGGYWIADADLERVYPTGEPLPELLSSGPHYDAAEMHGETLWFAHDCVPSHFD